VGRNVWSTFSTRYVLPTSCWRRCSRRSVRTAWRALALPTLPVDERRSGLTWLVGNYGHGREHVGQIQLTRQLYRARSTTA